MGMLAASVFSFMLMILSMMIQLGLFLIRHFEVMNSLLASILVQLLTINIEINTYNIDYYTFSLYQFQIQKV